MANPWDENVEVEPLLNRDEQIRRTNKSARIYTNSCKGSDLKAAKSKYDPERYLTQDEYEKAQEYTYCWRRKKMVKIGS